jgi:small subunit ribosomal protein S2
VAGSGMTKKELLHLRREHDKLDRTLGGIRDMARVPSAIWVVDTKKEHIAVNEARKLGIPVVAILDTNCDPDEVNYPIPGNDDAIRSVALLTRVVADAVAEGLIARAGASSTDEKPAGSQIGTEEPLAEWERELLQGAQTQVTPPDAAIVAAAEAEGPDDLAITAESAPSTEADAAADQADDLEGLAEAADEAKGDAEAAAAGAPAAADLSSEVAADAAAAAAEATDEAPLTETIGEITDAAPAAETE